MVIQIEKQKIKGERGEWWVRRDGHRIGVPNMTKREAIKSARVWCLHPIALQPCEVPGMLRAVASVLRQCGEVMEYRGGFGPWGAKGREAIGAAAIVREWADEMERKP